MGRCRDRRAWRPPRRYPREPRPPRLPRCRRRGAAFPEPTSLGVRTCTQACPAGGSDWIAGSGPAAFPMSQPINRTLVMTYLRNRGITALHEDGALRFHPRCYYRPGENVPTETWPAMIARVTDLDRRITGAHRTWLDPGGFDSSRLGKAPVDTPRR